MNIDKLVDQCYNALPSEWRNNPWSHLEHGTAVLNSENKLNAYIASYGEMHVAKCRRAMNNLPFEELKIQDFEIYDWGCGQGLGTLTLLQFLAERDILSNVRRINLIEPSTYALNRAKNWIRQSVYTRTEIRCFERCIPSNGSQPWVDMECSTRLAIHICSNILDIRSVGLKWLAATTASLSPDNIYVCVGPLFGGGISRIEDFHNYLGAPRCFTELKQFPCGITSRTKKSFGIEAKCFRVLNKQWAGDAYIEHSHQKWIDEYSPGYECLKGVIPDRVLHAYVILSKFPAGFEVYLTPYVGVERPDFILVSVTKGVVILNVCEDTSMLENEIKRVEAIKRAFIDTYIKRLKINTIINSSVYNCVKNRSILSE